MLDKRVPSLSAAIAGIKDGAVVLIGGFGASGIPVELIDALIDHGAKNLTIVTNNAGAGHTDIAKLLEVLQVLVDQGNTMLVIEHNLEVIKTADWIIDLGPEGGDKGGEIVGVGTPEDVAKMPGSYTGQYLAPHLSPAKYARSA